MARRGHGSTWCLRILLAVYAWKSSFPSARILTLGSVTAHVALAPLLPRKHCWSLVLGLDGLLAKDRLHHSARLEATWACRSARICQKH